MASAAPTDVRAVTSWLATVAPARARLTADSRAVAPGDVFLAWPGEQRDGRDFVLTAIDAGAAAVLYEARTSDALSAKLAGRATPTLAVAGLRDCAGAIASAWNGEPSNRLSVVAVTGTNGKTSCTHWIAAGWNLAQDKPVAAVVGTLGVGVPGALDPGGLTTPDALSLQQAFARFVAGGLQLAAIEASSIGIEQGRLNGTRIAVAVLTNLTRDHLDYHGTMQAYADAKARLFAWPDLGAIVVNLEDALSARLLADAAVNVPCIGYLVDDAGEGDAGEGDASTGDAGAGDAARARTEAAFERAGRCGELLIASPSDTVGQVLLTHMIQPADDEAPPETASVDIELALLGRFNLCNALAVAGAWRALGWSLGQIAEGLAALRPVPGRLEIVPGSGEGLPLVVVDYAHTPDALANTLGALRPIARARGGRLWCVFGAGGDRDPGKRPMMAATVQQHADRLVITSDNPRTEQPDAIIAGLVSGLTTSPDAAAGDVRIEPDRAAAIAATVADAAANDVVLIAGKGHEDYQEIAGVRHPFSDAVEARRVLDRLAERLAADAPAAAAPLTLAGATDV